MCPPQSPGTRAYSHPPRSAYAACAPSHEVQRPHLIGGRGRRQWQPRHARTALAPPLPHLQPFQPIEPADPLVIHPPALAYQPVMQPAIAKAPELLRQFAQPLPQPPVLRAPRPVSVRPSMQSDQPAGASLRDHDFRAHHYHRLLPHLRAYHFFATTACNACLSNARSATRCFSRRFSSSRARNRRASLTCIPPYFAFQRYRLPCVMPCRRHNSPGSAPASDSLTMAMICSSLNRLLRTTPPQP